MRREPKPKRQYFVTIAFVAECCPRAHLYGKRVSAADDREALRIARKALMERTASAEINDWIVIDLISGRGTDNLGVSALVHDLNVPCGRCGQTRGFHRADAPHDIDPDAPREIALRRCDGFVGDWLRPGPAATTDRADAPKV